MNRIELMKLNELVKTIQTDLFIIYQDRIIGCDVSLVIVGELYCITNADKPYEFTRKVWDVFIKAVEKEPTDRDDYNVWLEKFSIKRVSESPVSEQYRKMCTVYSEDNLCNTIKIENFQDSENFSTFKALRADDGATLIKIDSKHMFYMYAKMININSGDKVDLTISDIYSSPELEFIGFVLHYYIKKKKGGHILHKAIAYRALC